MGRVSVPPVDLTPVKVPQDVVPASSKRVSTPFEERRDAAVIKAREDRAIAAAVKADEPKPDTFAPAVQRVTNNTLGKGQRIFHPASQSMFNGFPPADDLVIVMAVIVVIGNVANNKKDITGYIKILTAAFMLAIVLGLVDRGNLRAPVRAFASLGVLAATLYYVPIIFPKMNQGLTSSTSTPGPTKTIGKGTHKVTSPANKFSQEGL